MKKTLLLVFIHGFKGTDQTFSTFPAHIAALLSHVFPSLSISTKVYPSFETRGDLSSCVIRFRDWLQNAVIDLEVAAGTPSPTIEPGVRVVLVGHSMGGIVAAETVLGIVKDSLEDGRESRENGSGGDVAAPGEKGLCMFPYIQGVLAFDTPYLGISPGVVAHGAEGQWNASKAWYDTAAGLWAMGTAVKGGSKAKEEPKEEPTPPALNTDKAIPAPPSSSASPWSAWGTYAMYAGAASAVAAGSVAAYVNRETITTGLGWATSHLEFIGCLARGEELKQRLAGVAGLREPYGVGFGDIYTCLGKGAGKQNSEWSTKALGADRTFCNLPKSDLKGFFHKAVNDAASAETWAHMEMFIPKENPGYYTMSEQAKELISSWVPLEWVDSSGDIHEYIHPKQSVR